MAQTLLNKVINKDITVDVLIKWLLETNSQEQYFSGFSDSTCSRADFLTYFLNFIHEEIPCLNKYNEIPQKLTAYKLTEPIPNKETPSRLAVSESKPNITKSASFPLQSLDRSERLDNSPTSSTNVWLNTSTPKITRIQSESTFNNAQVIPISPLYRNNTSFTTPKNDRQNFTNKSSERGSALCLGDFIVNTKSLVKKKTSRNIFSNETLDESSRRIKPTSINQVKLSSSFRECNNSFNNFHNSKEVSIDNLNNSRAFLAEERLKILTRQEATRVTSTKKIGNLLNNCNCKAEIEPDVTLVTNKEGLNCCIEIYVNILKNNFVLNINSEIYFLISLLLAKYHNDDKTATNLCDGIDFLRNDECEGRNPCGYDLFENVHNVVYFSTKCLESQVDVLKYYDKSTLSLLSKNKRLKSFSSLFAEKLAKISEKKSERIVELTDSNVQTNVCFDLDTDNRENFPSDSAFHTFRKQRDLFYEILGVWEAHHLKTDWNYSISLGGKIRNLFSMQSEPANFVHFSRLFKAQLLGTCGKFQKEEGLSDIPFLSSIPNVDTEKLNRLNCRLVTKQTSSGINSVPTFTGYQEFYKDFIVVAANYAFNKHLCDSFIAEIVELNDTKFSCTDLNEIEHSVDASTRKSYIACLKLLRVLAKFLGFVESLPYKSGCSSLSDKVVNFQINLRKEVTPVFDVKNLIENSLKQHNAILVIPWVAKYFAMLDYVTLRLPYYLSVHQILFNLYKNCDEIFENRPNYSISLIKFSLGWLFELPHFPDSEYFNFCTRTTVENVPKAKTPKKKTKVKEEHLDKLDIVDQNILYVCCPYLEEIKRLLSCNARNDSVTVKHITPVTAAQSSSEIAKKKLEQQLEEAFFNGQPLSVRKTVEFVSERVASACVKHICSAVVPPFKKTALDKLKDFLILWAKEQNLDSPTKDKSVKMALRSKVNQMAQSNLKTLRENCDTEVFDIIKARVPSSVGNLLSVDALPQTTDVCVTIATRICIDRVRQWIDSHVTLAVFMKDFNTEMQKVLCSDSKRVVKEKPVFLLPAGGENKQHNENATSAFYILEKLKELSMVILEKSGALEVKVVGNVLEETYTTLTERSDVNGYVTMYTSMLLVDVSLLLITHYPNMISEEDLLRKFLRVWRCYGGKMSELFKNLFCSRNVMLLAQSGNDVVVWETLASFVAFLLKENAISYKEIESQCTAFYRKEWDQVTLKNFASFMRKFLENYRSSSGNTHKFTLLIEFLSDMCTDLS